MVNNYTSVNLIIKKALFIFGLALFSLCSFNANAQVFKNEKKFLTPFEKSNGTQTGTYWEVIDFYQKLDHAYPTISLEEIGKTDSGKPLHLVVFNPEKNFNLNAVRQDKLMLLINNGIHPGEPDGIEATMMLMRDYAQDKIKAPKDVLIAAIAIYNVGGALNRNSTTRVNQNGPESYGFRGNARNYDLNRDFIKADTKNAFAFYEVFHKVKPDVFVGTHVSNGADYQYTLTHLFTQHNKLGGKLGKYLENEFKPELKQKLLKEGWPTTPYVNVFNRDPSTGFTQFMDSPRYSSGYTTLWNSLGMMVETHMLKPFDQRVWATYDLLKVLVSQIDAEAEKIEKLRAENFDYFSNLEYYPIHFTVDSSKLTQLTFRGYKAETVKSKVTGFPRLKYNRNKPYTKTIDYYNYYKPTDSIKIPEAYIIPKSQWDVIARFKANHIEMIPLKKDTIITVEVYQIEDFKTVDKAYEGHYLHYNTEVSKTRQKMKFHQGDYIVPTDQKGIRYIIETLEPETKDSFFNWNFFDVILQQKEHFSAYVFEDLAYKFLQNHPKIKSQFEKKRKQDKAFRKNPRAQLNWIYRRTPHYENAHMRYPIYRVNE